jgi:hypothetical protein
MAALRSDNFVFLRALPAKYPAIVFKKQDCYGVSILVDNKMVISERFASVILRTEMLNFSGSMQNYLSLSCKREDVREQFSTVCAEFVEPGENGVLRDVVASKPLEWWSKWCQLMGNRMVHTQPYDVLGEMIALYYFANNGEKPQWLGPYSGTKDIETNNMSVEVKSTINRYGAHIAISGQFQLQRTEGKLALIFCRFEESGSGYSINCLIEKLCSKGMNREFLIDALENLGYEQGSSVLNKPYKLLEIRQYEIDSSFPAIVPASFVGNKIPDGILKIQYTVDLDGLGYTPVSLQL